MMYRVWKIQLQTGQRRQRSGPILAWLVILKAGVFFPMSVTLIN